MAGPVVLGHQIGVRVPVPELRSSSLTVSCDTLFHMCETCGDVYRFTDWTQLALDDTHEVWFMGRECMCGYTIMRAMTLETAKVVM